jgi:hypothetical protein
MSSSSFHDGSSSSSSGDEIPFREWSHIATELTEELDRLRWSIFEPTSNVQVDEDPDSPFPQGAALADHPLAAVPATQPPIAEIAFSIGPLTEWETNEYEAPEPVYVCGSNGGAVTIKDMVEQLAPYFLAHKDDILEAKGPMIECTHEIIDGQHVIGIPAYDSDHPVHPDTKVWFEGFLSRFINVGDHSVHVEMRIEGERE